MILDFKNFLTKNSSKKNLIFFALLLCICVFLIWKCKYGIGNIDEAFYLTIPFRLYKGDALFLQEWHVTQMAGFLTFPLVSLYIKVFGSTEGIILAMRYICVFVQCLVAIFTYFRLKKISWIGALISSLSFVLYIPFGITALSYNSMGIFFQVLSYVIIITAEKHKNFQFVLSGLLFAASTLCCPYLLLVFTLYVLVVVLLNLICKIKKQICTEIHFILTFKGFAFFTLGAMLLAFVFLAFVLSRASFSELISSLQFILDDPEHPQISILTKLYDYFAVIILNNITSIALYSGYLILFFILLVDQKRKKHKGFYFTLACVSVFCFMIYYFSKNYINYTMWSINLFAPIIVFITDSKIIKQLFCFVWIPGMLYSVCLNLASNQLFYAISSASSVATVGSIMMISVFSFEVKNSLSKNTYKKATILFTTIVFVFQISSQTFMRYNSVFWETGMDSQTQLIDEGICNGLLSSKESAKKYNILLKNLKLLEKYESNQILFLSSDTRYCLTDNFEVCAYSAWLSGINNHTIGRLKDYYELNPQKTPNVVFVDLSHKDVALKICEEMDFNINYHENGFVLTK